MLLVLHLCADFFFNTLIRLFSITKYALLKYILVINAISLLLLLSQYSAFYHQFAYRCSFRYYCSTDPRSSLWGYHCSSVGYNYSFFFKLSNVLWALSVILLSESKLLKTHSRMLQKFSMQLGLVFPLIVSFSCLRVFATTREKEKEREKER